MRHRNLIAASLAGTLATISCTNGLQATSEAAGTSIKEDGSTDLDLPTDSLLLSPAQHAWQYRYIHELGRIAGAWMRLGCELSLRADLPKASGLSFTAIALTGCGDLGRLAMTTAIYAVSEDEAIRQRGFGTLASDYVASWSDDCGQDVPFTGQMRAVQDGFNVSWRKDDGAVGESPEEFNGTIVENSLVIMFPWMMDHRVGNRGFVAFHLYALSGSVSGDAVVLRPWQTACTVTIGDDPQAQGSCERTPDNGCQLTLTVRPRTGSEND